MLGYTLIAAGVTRIVEIVFVLPGNFAATESTEERVPGLTNSSVGVLVQGNAFLHLTPFVSHRRLTSRVCCILMVILDVDLRWVRQNQ